jgi:sugar lactone lactonase YvrE
MRNRGMKGPPAVDVALELQMTLGAGAFWDGARGALVWVGSRRAPHRRVSKWQMYLVNGIASPPRHRTGL